VIPAFKRPFQRAPGSFKKDTGVLFKGHRGPSKRTTRSFEKYPGVFFGEPPVFSKKGREGAFQRTHEPFQRTAPHIKLHRKALPENNSKAMSLGS